MKKLLLLFVFVLFFNIVIAVPPQSSIAEAGYELRIPQKEFLKQGEDVTAHIHVFNVSNGVPIYPSTSDVGCMLHVYDQVGNHIVEEPMEEDGNGLEWDIFVDGGNFTELGQISIVLWCNDSTMGGFVSTSFEVTGTGHGLSQAKSLLYIVILSVLVLLFIVNMVIIPMLPSGNIKEGELITINHLKYVRSVLYVTAYMLLVSITFTTSNLAIAYLEDGMFGSLLFTIFEMLSWLMLPMVVVWLIYVFYMIFQDKQTKNMLSRGIGVGEI